jgi:hypothetical protein
MQCTVKQPSQIFSPQNKQMVKTVLTEQKQHNSLFIFINGYKFYGNEEKLFKILFYSFYSSIFYSFSSKTTYYELNFIICAFNI